MLVIIGFLVKSLFEGAWPTLIWLILNGKKQMAEKNKNNLKIEPLKEGITKGNVKKPKGEKQGPPPPAPQPKTNKDSKKD